MTGLAICGGFVDRRPFTLDSSVVIPSIPLPHPHPNTQHTFPPQPQALAEMARIAQREKEADPRTVFYVGCYSIGKERCVGMGMVSWVDVCLGWEGAVSVDACVVPVCLMVVLVWLWQRRRLPSSSCSMSSIIASIRTPPTNRAVRAVAEAVGSKVYADERKERVLRLAGTGACVYGDVVVSVGGWVGGWMDVHVCAHIRSSQG